MCTTPSLSLADFGMPLKQEEDWETATTEAGSTTAGSRRPSIAPSAGSDDDSCCRWPSIPSSCPSEQDAWPNCGDTQRRGADLNEMHQHQNTDAAFHSTYSIHPLSAPSWSGNVGPRGKSAHGRMSRRSTNGGAIGSQCTFDEVRSSSSVSSDVSATFHSSHLGATSLGTSGNVGPRGRGSFSSKSIPRQSHANSRCVGKAEETFSTVQDAAGWSGNVGPRGRRCMSASRVGRCGGSGLAAVRAAKYWSSEDKVEEQPADSNANYERTLMRAPVLEGETAAFHSRRHTLGGSGNIGPRGRGAR